jgi:hypothetical protein
MNALHHVEVVIKPDTVLLLDQKNTVVVHVLHWRKLVSVICNRVIAVLLNFLHGPHAQKIVVAVLLTVPVEYSENQQAMVQCAHI